MQCINDKTFVDLDGCTVSPLSTPTERDKLLFADATTPSTSFALSSPPRVKCSSPAVKVVSLASPTWIAVRNQVAGSRKRMRISAEDKENSSLPIRSPSQRVASNMSEAELVHQRPTTPKKRKLQNDVDDNVEHLSPSKKSRSDAVFSHSTNIVSSTSDADDEDDIANSLLVSPASSDEVVPSPRKRKRMIMILESVEVPSVKSVTMQYRKSAQEKRKKGSDADW